MSDQGDDDRRRQVGSPGEYKRRDRFDDSPRYGGAAGAPPEPAEDFTQLYVNGLSRSVRYDSLSALFSGCGEVSDIQIKTKYAFVRFKKHEDAVYAIKELNNTNFEGNKLLVEPSYPSADRRKRTSGPQADDKCFSCGLRGHW